MNNDDFWTDLATGHTNTVLAGSMDSHLSGKTIDESFGTVRTLVAKTASPLPQPGDIFEATSHYVDIAGMGQYDESMIMRFFVQPDGSASVMKGNQPMTHKGGQLTPKAVESLFRRGSTRGLGMNTSLSDPRIVRRGRQASRLDLREGHYYIVLDNKAHLWGDWATSIGGWNGEKALKKGDILRFLGWRLGDWGPSQPIFESERLGVKGFFHPTSGGMDTNPHPRALRYYAKELSGNRQASVMRVASLGDLTQFLKRADGKLVHKSTNDLWSYSKDADGNFLVERLFDDEGEPLKG